jgi:hypothetical protein
MSDRLKHAICLIPIVPLIPFMLLTRIAQFVAIIGEWCVEESPISTALVRVHDRLERHFKIDPESQHQQWRSRMGFNYPEGTDP